MGACMIQIFAFEPNLSPSQLFRPASRMVHRAGASYKMSEFVGEFALKISVFTVFGIRLFKFVKGMNQRFGNKRAAILAKMTLFVGQSIGFQGINPGYATSQKPQRVVTTTQINRLFYQPAT